MLTPNKNYRLKGSILTLAAIMNWCWSAPCQSADAGMDVTLNANIVENTCQISIANNGKVSLPTVSKSWFYNVDGTTRLQPTDDAGGTPFAVKIDNCPLDDQVPQKFIFSFQPQSKEWPESTRQVFINETSVAAGGADNTGVVIFSKAHNTNVLSSEGNSSVELVANEKWGTEYPFYARLQNTGAVSVGKVTSRVLVNAIYE
ncbi:MULTISPECIES: fimbrial-like protein [Enterobacter]|uniref:Fimbrial-like protein n=1 Tax=Enterobacter cloacae complex sp. Mu1197 TaxID=3152302 RepID=A0AAU7FZK7_9ENTR|nr:fimbrial-like protein [Enterobacter quasiroggenkampii]